MLSPVGAQGCRPPPLHTNKHRHTSSRDANHSHGNRSNSDNNNNNNNRGPRGHQATVGPPAHVQGAGVSCGGSAGGATAAPRLRQRRRREISDEISSSSMGDRFVRALGCTRGRFDNGAGGEGTMWCWLAAGMGLLVGARGWFFFLLLGC